MLVRKVLLGYVSYILETKHFLSKIEYISNGSSSEPMVTCVAYLISTPQEVLDYLSVGPQLKCSVPELTNFSA